MSRKSKVIHITPGDSRGIGPEVTRKALRVLQKKLKSVKLVIYSEPFKHEKSLQIRFVPPPKKSPGFQCGWAIEQSTKSILNDPTPSCLVTGPIHKSSLNEGGFKFKGHTDFLEHLTGSKNAIMVLTNDWFRVALATTHCPLKEVSQRLSIQKISDYLVTIAQFSKLTLGINEPKIAVLGLNPHAGENGLLGSEEKKIILPAMKKAALKLKHLNIKVELTGPHPADSFFAIEMRLKKTGRGHDFILAMYHDQGLIPVKLSDFSNAMNLTLGLPFIRTSVDHGTAFDIAGKNKADPGSMVYAIKKALEYL